MDYLKPYQEYFAYFVETPPATTPVSLVEVKEWLKLDAGTSEDAKLNLLILAATTFCESYTRRTLINTEFKTIRSFFSPAIELRRTLLQSVTSFKYTVDSSLVDVDSALYYPTKEKDFSHILLRSNSAYPENGDDIFYGIEIVFVAGYGTASTNVPPDIRVAILNHIAALYENRGDCDKASILKALPNAARLLYDAYRPIEIA